MVDLKVLTKVINSTGMYSKPPVWQVYAKS